jgi:hypothetical protein
MVKPRFALKFQKISSFLSQLPPPLDRLSRRKLLMVLLLITIFVGFLGITADAGQGPSQWCSTIWDCL